VVWKTRISWAVFVIGGLWVASLEGVRPAAGPPWLRALAGGYVTWALYWGLPVVWRRRRAFLDRLREWITFKGQLTRWAACESIFWTWAVLFSVLGGGLLQFAQVIRRRRGSAPRRPLVSVMSARSPRPPTSHP
jgi:hypothetical protein